MPPRDRYPPPSEVPLPHAAHRARRILKTQHRELPVAVTPVGMTKDVWVLKHDVLVVDRSWRFRRVPVEVKLARALPRSVRYPKILGSGITEGSSWMLQKRAKGRTLASLLPSLTAPEIEGVLRDILKKITSIQSVERAPDLIGRRSPPLYVFDHEDAAGILSRMAGYGWLSPKEAKRLSRLHLTGMESASRLPRVLVHGDLHADNVMVRKKSHEVSAILDFEAAGIGPSDLEYFKLYESLAYETAGRKKHAPDAAGILESMIAPILRAPGAGDRWAGYAISRTLQRIERNLVGKERPGETPEKPERLVRELLDIASGTSLSIPKSAALRSRPSRIVLGSSS